VPGGRLCDELRGRHIVTLQGNWSDNYWDWLDYASSDIQLAQPSYA